MRCALPSMHVGRAFTLISIPGRSPLAGRELQPFKGQRKTFEQMKVEKKFAVDIVTATDNAVDTLTNVAKTLKSDQMQELKRAGFDLDRVEADLMRWQRSFRLLVNKLNAEDAASQA